MSIKEDYIEWLAKNPKGWSSATKKNMKVRLGQ